MSLSDIFSQTGYTFNKASEYVLSVSVSTRMSHVYYAYDFAARLMTVASSKDAMAAFPFSQLDRETLESYRNKLIELGGTPPELPVLQDVPTLSLKKSVLSSDAPNNTGPKP